MKTKKYVIKKGKSYSKGRILGLFNYSTDIDKTLSFVFKLDESWLYPASYNKGWCKIMGFKKGLFGIHKNSARLGVRCVGGNTIKFAAYCYVDGVPVRKCFTKIQPRVGKRYTCLIQETEFLYIFQLIDTDLDVLLDSMYIQRMSETGKDITFTNSYKRYVSFPYFCSDLKAPHNIITYIKRLGI